MTEGDPFGLETAHVVIDMQRLFAEGTAWHMPDLAAIIPNVRRLAEGFAGRNHFARFTVPHRAEDAPGRWKAYYRTWHLVTTAELDPAYMDVVPELADLVEPTRLIDKPTYSIFKVPGLAERLHGSGLRRLVFSGVETDACVLASVMGAIDAGFHTVVVTDAVASGAPEAHRAVLNLVLPRLSVQVEMLDADAVLARLA